MSVLLKPIGLAIGSLAPASKYVHMMSENANHHYLFGVSKQPDYVTAAVKQEPPAEQQAAASADGIKDEAPGIAHDNGMVLVSIQLCYRATTRLVFCLLCVIGMCLV